MGLKAHFKVHKQEQCILRGFTDRDTLSVTSCNELTPEIYNSTEHTSKLNVVSKTVVGVILCIYARVAQF